MTGPTLTAPFAHTSEIRKGAATLTYIPAAEVVERLNAVLGYGKWSYEVVEAFHTPAEDPQYVVARGRLCCLGSTYEQYGGVTPNRYGNNAAAHLKGRIIDLGDDYKGAASDALKKAAQMVGVGLYLALGRGPTPHVVEEGESVPPKPSSPSSTPTANRRTASASERRRALVEPGDASAGDGEVPADAKPYLAEPKLQEAREALKK